MLDEARCAVEQTSKNNKCGDEGDRQQDLDPTENCAGAANKPNGCGESGDQSVMMSPPTDQVFFCDGMSPVYFIQKFSNRFLVSRVFFRPLMEMVAVEWRKVASAFLCRALTIFRQSGVDAKRTRLES